MIKAPIYTIKGTKTGDQILPKEVFEVKPNLNMLAQAIHVYEERGHVGTRNTQTRSEVNRTTKKVYKQKGTGGARHGSRRANLFVGGGVIFGPRPLRRELTLSAAMRTKAKVYAFSLKAGEKEIIVVEGINKITKTKVASEFLKNLSKASGPEGLAPLQRSSSSGGRPGGRFTFILSEKGLGARMFLRNLSKVVITSYKDISALDIYNGGMLVLDSVIFEKEPHVAKALEGKKEIKK